MTNRVVITGYGVVSAIGNSPEEFWNNLKAGKTGIGPITHFDACLLYTSPSPRDCS